MFRLFSPKQLGESTEIWTIATIIAWLSNSQLRVTLALFYHLFSLRDLEKDLIQIGKAAGWNEVTPVGEKFSVEFKGICNLLIASFCLGILRRFRVNALFLQSIEEYGEDCFPIH